MPLPSSSVFLSHVAVFCRLSLSCSHVCFFPVFSFVSQCVSCLIFDSFSSCVQCVWFCLPCHVTSNLFLLCSHAFPLPLSPFSIYIVSVLFSPLSENLLILFLIFMFPSHRGLAFFPSYVEPPYFFVQFENLVVVSCTARILYLGLN